jgi:hypothetical protein
MESSALEEFIVAGFYQETLLIFLQEPFFLILLSKVEETVMLILFLQLPLLVSNHLILFKSIFLIVDF